MRARAWFWVGIAAVALGASGCGGAEPDTGATIPIEITASNFAFSPNAIDVEPGEEVDIVLVNEDDTPHSFTAEGIDVTAEPDGTATGSLIASAADIPFRCKFHPEMTGLLSTEGTTGGGGGGAEQTDPPAEDADLDY